MSIHKSKGLEFPIVFLCSTGKKFNMQDLNKPILLHQDIGFGVKYINSDKKIEYLSLSQEAVKIKSKKETISEEMRVLYVALTRAKEKLIITGTSKDLNKSIKEKEEQLELYSSEEKINSRLLEKYISYLDWLELVHIKSKSDMEKLIDTKKYKKADILEEMKNEERKIEKIQNLELNDFKKNQSEMQEEKERTEKMLQWKYPFIKSCEIPTKSSVTKLKQMEENAKEPDLEDLVTKEKIKRDCLKSISPKFMQEKQKLLPTQKGTLMHLCVQKLDETKDYTIEEIEKFLNELYKNGIISKQERKEANVQALYRYIKSELWQELKKAKEIHKEVPFYTKLPAKNIYAEAQPNESILVQGIIDLYYISKNDELILVDFKTDYIKKGEEFKLEEKYKIQLKLYKKALESALKRKVDKAMIYSLL